MKSLNGNSIKSPKYETRKENRINNNSIDFNELKKENKILIDKIFKLEDKLNKYNRKNVKKLNKTIEQQNKEILSLNKAIKNKVCLFYIPRLLLFLSDNTNVF